jgi:hypothetical protein
MKTATRKFIKASKIIVLVALPILLFTLLQWVWWFKDPRLDGLNKEMRQLSGWPAIDCGSVPINGDRGDVDNCVQSAFLAHKPFVARYEEQGMDSVLAIGIAATPQRQFYFLTYNSDPSGGSKTGERIRIRPCRGEKAINDDQFFVCD